MTRVILNSHTSNVEKLVIGSSYTSNVEKLFIIANV